MLQAAEDAVALREATWARVVERLPAQVLVTARHVFADMITVLVDGLVAWQSEHGLGRDRVAELRSSGERISQRLAWSLIDDVAVCLLEAVVSEAIQREWPDPARLARGTAEVSNHFFNGYWVVEGREVLEQAVRFGRLADRLPVAVFLADGDGVVTMANPALEELLGLAHGDLVGRPVDDVFQSRVQLGEGLVTDVYCACGGRRLNLRITVAAVPHRRQLEYFAAVHNRSHEVALEETRRRVVATISHELRTPLTAVLGYTELLMAGEESGMSFQEQSAALRTMHSEAELLLRLVHDLVDYARLETGRLAVDPAVFRLEEAVEAAMRRTASPVSPVVRVDIPPELKLLADRARIEQVLTNLLTNAQRYGGGRVWVTACAEGDDLVLRVRDDGPGVPFERREEVFQTFFQGHNDTGVGAGIGLAVCRAVVKAHGGTIELEEAPGASFRIHLPEAIV